MVPAEGPACNRHETSQRPPLKSMAYEYNEIRITRDAISWRVFSLMEFGKLRQLGKPKKKKFSLISQEHSKQEIDQNELKTQKPEHKNTNNHEQKHV